MKQYTAIVHSYLSRDLAGIPPHNLVQYIQSPRGVRRADPSLRAFIFLQPYRRICGNVAVSGRGTRNGPEVGQIRI